MPAARIPENESARLQALESLAVLDTLAEEQYDDIVRIAAQICGAPTALISLVDRERQWFKARLGLDAQETPRAHAFCAHAIADAEPLVVRDAEADPRFEDNPLVVGEPGIRFYAGAPIEFGDDIRLGTLCVIDYQPRDLDAGQLETLQALSRQVTALLQLRRRNQELAQAAEELKRSNEELDRFAYTVSHDLREPLRSVCGFTDLLKRRHADELSGDGREFLDLVSNSAHRMDAMIGGLLELAKAGRDDWCPVPVELDQVMRHAQANLNDAIRRSDAEIEVAALPCVPGEEALLVQLFQNLLANSIKFARDGVAPRIRVAASREADGSRITVSDNGRGIEAGALESVGELFRRGAGNDAIEGLGLGLTLCRRIAERHGGRLELESEPGQGTRVSVLLPDSRGAVE